MFEQLFRSSDCVEKHRNAPLAKERVRYLEHLAQSGHSASSLSVAASRMLTAIHHMNLGNESRLSQEEIGAAAKDVALATKNASEPDLFGRLGPLHTRSPIGSVLWSGSKSERRQ